VEKMKKGFMFLIGNQDWLFCELVLAKSAIYQNSGYRQYSRKRRFFSVLTFKVLTTKWLVLVINCCCCKQHHKVDFLYEANNLEKTLLVTTNQK
jgi:hypothetical protein